MSKIDEVIEGVCSTTAFQDYGNKHIKQILKNNLKGLRIANDDEVIVPREPTTAMLLVGSYELGRQVRDKKSKEYDTTAIYKAMIQAAEGE